MLKMYKFGKRSFGMKKLGDCTEVGETMLQNLWELFQQKYPMESAKMTKEQYKNMGCPLY